MPAAITAYNHAHKEYASSLVSTILKGELFDIKLMDHWLRIYLSEDSYYEKSRNLIYSVNNTKFPESYKGMY